MKRFRLFFNLVLFVLFSFHSFADDIKDIKPPIDFAKNYFFLFMILGLILITAVLFLVIFLIRKFKKKKSKLITIKPAYIIAYEQLEVLRKKNLPTLGKIKEYYYELSLIIRYYLENRFQLKALEMTTDEFLYVLQSSHKLTDVQKQALKSFLKHCDLVKFAKYGPSSDEITKSFDISKSLIDETKLI